MVTLSESVPLQPLGAVTVTVYVPVVPVARLLEVAPVDHKKLFPTPMLVLNTMVPPSHTVDDEAVITGIGSGSMVTKVNAEAVQDKVTSLTETL
jgi:hypothetical protein